MNRFLEFLCGYQFAIGFVLVFDVLLLVLATFALLLGPEDPGSVFLLWVDFALLGGFFVVVVAILRECRKL